MPALAEPRSARVRPRRRKPVRPRRHQRRQLPYSCRAIVGRAPGDRIWYLADLRPFRRAGHLAGEHGRRHDLHSVLESGVHAVAGFTVGRSQSFFDLFTYDGAYSYHTVTVQGDTSATGINLWAYSAAFGSGVSGTLSLEDPGGHNRAATVDANAAAFGVNAAVTGDTAFADQNSTLNGFRLPDVVANLRVDQAWGFAGISGALHDASGAYYGAANNVANGHPADKLGWAFAVGGKLNLPGDDMIGANACYSEGATGFCTGVGSGLQVYDSSSSVGVGWLADGIFDTGTDIQVTRVWSAVAAYEHVWHPKWRTSWFGGYVNVSYTDAAKTIIHAHMPGEGGTACAECQ